MDSQLSLIEKNVMMYICNDCEYATKRKTDYTKHILTRKHIQITMDNGLSSHGYTCECGKTYQHQSGLCKHRHKCKGPGPGPGQDISETTLPKPEEMMALMFKLMCDKLPDKSDQSQLVIELLKQNQDFKEIMLEQSKQLAEQQLQLLEAVKDGKLGNNNTTNCNNTTNNKFNLNVFLNETCKDAISMDDFINSIEVTRDEFIHTGQVGYIEGISTVMAHRFRDMDVHTRPLHCTDLKRETIYIKNADKWEKDDADKTNMRKAVRGVAKKNMKELWRWYNDNKPQVEQIGTDVCEDYFKYHKAALGGYGKEEDLKFEDKIMRNVLKEVHVDKSTSLTL
jgi:hypothetical protein